jgi:hypothetical protein
MLVKKEKDSSDTKQGRRFDPKSKEFE